MDSGFLYIMTAISDFSRQTSKIFKNPIPGYRHLYWTTPTAIMMSNLDGSDVREFTTSVRDADGLVVDAKAQRYVSYCSRRNTFMVFIHQ